MHDETGEDFPLEVEWEVSPLHLYLLHVLSGRMWDIKGTLRYPTPEEIEARVQEMIEVIRDLGAGVYLTLNGLKIYKDPEFPDSYEVYVKVAHASPRIPEDSK